MKFVFFSETENEVQSCYKQWICNSIVSKPLMDMQGQAEDKENLCHTLYNCHHRKFISGETVEDVLDHIVDLGAKYLGLFSSSSLKTGEKNITFSQFVYFLREVCLLFNF